MSAADSRDSGKPALAAIVVVPDTYDTIRRTMAYLQAQTVAEQVETDDVIAKLREIEVDFAQGFGLGRPQSLDELT